MLEQRRDLFLRIYW